MKKKAARIGRPPKKPAEVRSKSVGLKFTPAEFAIAKTLTPAQMREAILAAATAARRKR